MLAYLYTLNVFINSLQMVYVQVTPQAYFKTSDP